MRRSLPPGTGGRTSSLHAEDSNESGWLVVFVMVVERDGADGGSGGCGSIRSSGE